MIRLESLVDAPAPASSDVARQQCIRPACGATYGLTETHQRCERCGALLDVVYDWERVPLPARLELFDARRATFRNPLDYSGVWRFRELIPFAELDKVLTIGEGQTQLRRTDGVADYVGVQRGNLFLQYEGLNPSGSFKDNGMTGAFTHARMVGARYAACASTGNTSASLALFAGVSGLLRAVVFVGSGKIAYGKLSQALDYGAATLQIDGDFDDAMRQVQEVCRQTDLYLMNSLNPFRLEGQKAIMYRVLEGLGWLTSEYLSRVNEIASEATADDGNSLRGIIRIDDEGPTIVSREDLSHYEAIGLVLYAMENREATSKELRERLASSGKKVALAARLHEMRRRGQVFKPDSRESLHKLTANGVKWIEEDVLRRLRDTD